MLIVGLSLILFSFTDIAERRIPKRLNLLAATMLLTEPSTAIIGVLIWLVYLFIFRLSGGAMGYGDVRLAPLTALIASNPASAYVLHLQAWAAAGLFFLTFKGRCGNQVPFAPFVALSAALLQVSC